MKIADLFPIIMEAPLPDTWDKSLFHPDKDFGTMLSYAKWQADKLGSGSARVAFTVPYRGRTTVIKIAKNNAKGTAQNFQEARFLSKQTVSTIGITIPIIDYDEANGNRPVWIHTELAEKINLTKLQSAFGGYSIQDIIAYLTTGKFSGDLKSLTQNKNFIKLKKLLDSNPSIDQGDLATPENWGLYNGNPVIIDLGFSTEVRKLHYPNK